MGDWITWSLSWTRPLSSHEITELIELRTIIQNIRLRPNTSDSIAWNEGYQGTFDTGSFVKATDTLAFEDLNLDPLVAKAWCKMVPPRVEFLTWLILQRKIHTRGRLVRKGILAESLNVCPICREEEETDSHLLIHCKYVHPLWQQVLNFWKIPMALPNDPFILWQLWRATPIRGRLMRKIWTTIFHAITSTVWYTKNDIIFAGGTWNAQVIEFRVKYQVGAWIKIWNPSFTYAPEVVARLFDHIYRLLH